MAKLVFWYLGQSYNSRMEVFQNCLAFLCVSFSGEMKFEKIEIENQNTYSGPFRSLASADPSANT